MSKAKNFGNLKYCYYLALKFNSLPDYKLACYL